MWEYKTCDGETPLTLAAKAGFAENVRTLLEKGVWPNTTNDKGETPLLIGNCLLSLGLNKVNGNASPPLSIHPSTPVGLCGLDAGRLFR